jgi:hypothetical protein
MSAPKQAIVRAFNVGFGDCFLLTFVYAKGGDRHVLIDFGSTRLPENPMPKHMVKVAEEIGKLTGNKLHIVVATHRHKDHISGFETNKKKDASGDIIRSYKPSLVLQPWTEDPDIPVDADGPRAFARSLSNMNAFAARLHSFAEGLTEKRMETLRMSAVEKAHLSFLGENNIANKSAIENLMSMAKVKYLHADMKLSVAQLLPGVDVTVMGPPTVDQHEEVATQNPKNADEYWHLAARNSSGMAQSSKSIFPGFQGKRPLYAKWIEHRLMQAQKEGLFGIVRDLDKAMNNTSLILLFKAGNKSLLFPGDAQWENWQYALSKPAYVKMLKAVDLYKVGHHGSLNATPKTLWKHFGKKSDKKGSKTRMKSVMSTKHGVHGHSASTAVPRSTLVDALELETHHHSTEHIPDQKLYHEIVFDLT